MINVRPLTDRELEDALIATNNERDSEGRHTAGYLQHLVHFDSLGAFELTLPTHEGFFL